MRRIIILMLCLFPVLAIAADHPEANFGLYGIRHRASLSDYQQYVGEVVQYIPKTTATGNLSYDDEQYFVKKGGKIGVDYVISSITGSDKQMTFLLQEKNGKKKVKMIVNNQNEYYSYGKYAYCITDKYSIPLFLSGRFEKDKEKYVGMQFPESKVEIIDARLEEESNNYPKPVFVVKDNYNGKEYLFNPEGKSDFDDFELVFTNAKYNCTYSVINVEWKTEKYYPYLHKKYYLVRNSMSLETKEIEADEFASSAAFLGDDSGSFTAVLENVEKPANPDVRFGETAVVTDKGVTKYTYEDNFISILIFATSSQFSFVLKNLSDNSIKVVWNEAVFVDVDGSTSKIMHSGIKYSQREADQPASTIIKGAKLDDVIIPTDKVYYSDVLETWTNRSIFSKAKEGEGTNQTIKLMLPLQIKDVVNEYIFNFRLGWKYDKPALLVSTQ